MTVVFKRMKEAVKIFDGISGHMNHSLASNDDNANMALQIKKLILGLKYNNCLTGLDATFVLSPVPFSLNSSQVTAITASLQNMLTLIQGPPGTGKTVISAIIACHLRQTRKCKVLVCAPSNVAVGNILEKMLQLNPCINVVRVESESRELYHDHHGESRLIQDKSLYQMVLKRCPEVIRLADRIRDKREVTRLKRMKRDAEYKILKKAHFVLCTCSVAGDGRLVRHKFSSCLIDEAGQSMEPETIIPFSLTLGRVVLVGDQKTIGTHCKIQGSTRSRDGYFSVPKAGQRRYSCHSTQDPSTECILPSVIFPSKQFYTEETLSMELLLKIEGCLSIFPWKRRDTPILFINVSRGQESRGRSKENTQEAEMVMKCIHHFIREGFEPARHWSHYSLLCSKITLEGHASYEWRHWSCFRRRVSRERERSYYNDLCPYSWYWFSQRSPKTQCRPDSSKVCTYCYWTWV